MGPVFFFLGGGGGGGGHAFCANFCPKYKMHLQNAPSISYTEVWVRNYQVEIFRPKKIIRIKKKTCLQFAQIWSGYCLKFARILPDICPNYKLSIILGGMVPPCSTSSYAYALSLHYHTCFPHIYILMIMSRFQLNLLNTAGEQLDSLFQSI